MRLNDKADRGAAYPQPTSQPLRHSLSRSPALRHASRPSPPSRRVRAFGNEPSEYGQGRGASYDEVFGLDEDENARLAAKRNGSVDNDRGSANFRAKTGKIGDVLERGGDGAGGPRRRRRETEGREGMFAHPPNDASKGRAVDSCLEPAAERAPAPPRGLGVAVLRKRERCRVGSPRDRATRRRRRANHRVVVSELTAPEDARRVSQSRRERSPHPRAAGGDGGARCGTATACRRAEGHGGARRQGHRGVAMGCGEAGKISEALAVREFSNRSRREVWAPVFPVWAGTLVRSGRTSAMAMAA